MLPPTLSCIVRSRWHAAVAEQPRQLAMRDRRADLRLDVVADDRHAGLFEPLLPVGLAGDEDGHAVHHGAARVQDLLRVPLGCLLGADRQVVDDDVCTGLLEDPDHIVGWPVGLRRRARRRTCRCPSWAMPRETSIPVFGTSANLIRVVRVRPDCVGEVLADLVLDVTSKAAVNSTSRDVVAAEVDVHQAGDELVVRRVLVVLEALEQGVGAVTDADDRDPHLVFAAGPVAVRRCH